jgi:hypothetical protein
LLYLHVIGERRQLQSHHVPVLHSALALRASSGEMNPFVMRSSSAAWSDSPRLILRYSW